MNSRVDMVMDAYESKGYNCSQSIIAAYARDIGIEEETALDLFEGLGGGIGGCQDACGAVTTMACIIGWKCNRLDYDKPSLYGKVHEACSKFRDVYGSLTCLEILHGSAPRPKCCPDVVRRATEIIESLDL